MRDRGDGLSRETRLQADLLDTIPGCIALILKNGTREILASNRFARERGAVAGETCHSACISRESACPFCLAPELWATGETQQIEVQYDGEWYEAIWTPLSKDTYAHYIFDLTPRKQAEEALMAGAERHRLLADYASDVIWTMGPDGRFTYVSPSVARLRGYSVDEVMQQSIDEALTPESAAIAKAGIAMATEALEAGRPIPEFHGELEQPCKDGSTVWTDVTVSGIWDATGAFTGFLGVTRDISERKRAEEQLAKSERHFRSLIEQAADAIYVLTRDEGRILACNDRACKDTGYTREELLGMCASDLEVNLAAKEVDALHLSLRPGDSPTVEGIHQRKDGSTFPVEVRFALMEEGEPQLILSIVRDITERKQAEEALRLSEEQLRQSQKMEAIGQLAGGIAHDFNNLLTAIIGYSDLLLAGEQMRSSSSQDDVKEIKHAAERAAALTRQILAFSRRQALRPVVVSLNETIAGMEHLLRRTLGEDINLVTVLQLDLGLTEVDVNQFEQVLMNLAVNARDAMPLGGRLTLQTANATVSKKCCRADPGVEPGAYVVLSVTDDGLGMDEETVSRVFEPFFTTKAPGQGTGLGLSTAYGIVRQSGGTIEVQSEFGRGSTFKVYLPLVTSPHAQHLDRAAPSSSTSGSATILVVEDEASLRSLAVRMLERSGYTVLSAADAAEAFELLSGSNGSVDLLLTDVILSGDLQGNDLARMAKSLRPDLPVLYMSGYPRDAVVHAGRLDEGVNYLEKPFTPEALARKVGEVLGQWRSAG